MFLTLGQADGGAIRYVGDNAVVVLGDEVAARHTIGPYWPWITSGDSVSERDDPAY